MELRSLDVFWRFWTVLCAVHHVMAKQELKANIIPEQAEDNVYFELIAPEEISYTYKVRPAKGFGIELNRTLHNTELVPASPIHGCALVQNSDSIVGNIALMTRGECSFLTKTINAQRAGAQAVIVFDNEPTYDGRMIDMIPDDTKRTTTIPAFYLQGMDGKIIMDTLQKLGRESATVNIPVNITGVVLAKVHQPPWTLW